MGGWFAWLKVESPSAKRGTTTSVYKGMFVFILLICFCAVLQKAYNTDSNARNARCLVMTSDYIQHMQLRRVRAEIQNVETRETDTGVTLYHITFNKWTDSELYPSFDISAYDMDTCKTFVQCYYNKFAHMPGEFVYNASFWNSFCNFIGSMSRKGRLAMAGELES